MIWHTPVRFCPWDSRDRWLSKTITIPSTDVQPLSTEVEPRNIGRGESRSSVSQLSSPHASRSSLQTLVLPITPVKPLPRRTSHYPHPLPHSPARRATSQFPPLQVHSYLPPPRMVSLPPPPRGFRPSSSRVMSQLPPARIPSRPIPLRPIPLSHAVPLHSTRAGMTLSPSQPSRFPRGRDVTYNPRRASEMERDCEGWNRNRQGSALHRTRLA